MDNSNNNDSSFTVDDVKSLSSAYATVSLNFYNAYEEAYSSKVSEGIDDHKAKIEALEIANREASQTFQNLSAAAGSNSKLSAVYAEAALQSLEKAEDIKNNISSAEIALNEYSEAASNDYKNIFTNNPYIDLVAKYGGTPVDLAELAVNGATDHSEFIKTTYSIAFGAAGALIGEAIVAAGFASNPIVAGAFVAAGALGGSLLTNYGDETFWDHFEVYSKNNTLEDLGAWWGKEVYRLFPGMFDIFQSAKSFVRYSDPLALDLDGDGIETTAISDANTTLFDHDGDGVATGTGWLSGDDGWLVRDLNGNGTIDSGAEMFGDNTQLSDGSTAAEGFSALSDIDSNADGVIDANDAAFSELKIWQDLNQDGVTQAGELSSLTDLGIASINLNSTVVNQEQNGNNIQATSSFTRTDGTTGTVANLDLAESTFHSQFADANVGDETLPEMTGSGAVRSLRDAASRSTTLTNLLTTYASANHDGQVNSIDSLISAWADTSDMPTMMERAAA